MAKTCTTFIKILNTLNDEGIYTRQKLMENQKLHTAFWHAVDYFVSFALHSKTGKKNKEGEFASGNISKIEKLIEYGITTKEDLHYACMIKIMDKLDLVLNQTPIEKQKNYCYAICNNVVNDHFRMLPPEDVKIIYLQDTIKSNYTSQEDACAYEDVIGNFIYNGETYCIEQESILELSAILKEKKTTQRVEERDMVIKEIKSLSKKPAEILVHMACSHLGLKPRELATRILAKGGETIYAEVLFEVSKKVGLEITELRSIVKHNRFFEESVKANTKNADIIASQVSRLIYRAKQKLKK